ncbi:MAG: hypothetical protein KJN63_01535 [Acidimicrobiia bacterium]|nr:hypothetical protein [Acidimicrobiia bacterium]
MSRIGLALFCASLVASACASLGEPDLGSFPTTSAPPQANGGSDDQGVETEGPGEFSGVALEALPPRPPDYLPSIVVVTSTGVGVIEREASPQRFLPFVSLKLTDPVIEESVAPSSTSTTAFRFETTDADAEVTSTTAAPQPSLVWNRASDDLFGGLVLQATTGEIRWFPGTGGGVREVESEGTLVDVGYNAGTPEVLTERAGQIIRTRLIDNDTTVFTALQPGEELIDLSSSGGIVAIATSNEACGSVDFVGSDGTPLSINPFGTLVCIQTARPTVGAVAMSPDGEAIAYTMVDYREDGVELRTMLQAIELTSGAPILAGEIGGSGDVIDSLAFDGSTAVALRRSSAGNEVIVVDAETVEPLAIGNVGVPRSVTIARLPLSESLGL